ncbi:MAG: hypothetical protein ABIH59_02445 [archaeon]
MTNLMRNKGGWIRIVEAFVAVLLIAGVILTILDKGYIEREDPSEQIYEKENAILREIQIDGVLREEIITINDVSLPVDWGGFPSGVETKIKDETPNYLVCEAKICNISDSCLLDIDSEKNIYVRTASITATSTNYAARQLKLFCWMKEN